MVSQGSSDMLRAAFRNADVNGDGVISRDEVGNLLGKISSLSPSEMDQMFDLFDTDRNGKLNYEEFVEWLLSEPGQASKPDDQLKGQKVVVVDEGKGKGRIGKVVHIVDGNRGRRYRLDCEDGKSCWASKVKLHGVEEGPASLQPSDPEGRPPAEGVPETRAKPKQTKPEDTLAAFDFAAAFKQEQDKEQRQIATRIEAIAKEQIKSESEQGGGSLDKNREAIIRTKVKEQYSKSHPPWKLQSALAKKVADVIVGDLVDGLAKGCAEDMEIALARALNRGPVDFISSVFKRQGTLEKLSETIHNTSKSVSSEMEARGAQLNDKFKAELGEGVEMDFGTKADFFLGLEARIGPPSPALMKALIKEHCLSGDSRIEWTTGNYGITTTSFTEFLLVLQEVIKQCDAETNNGFPSDWRKAALKFSNAEDNLPPMEAWPKKWPKETIHPEKGRNPESQCFLKVLHERNKELEGCHEKVLTLEEGILLRLYTGPIFEKYNAVPRGGAINAENNEYLAKVFHRLCSGKDGELNRYLTSIHTLSSGVVKLSKLTPVKTVYRGLGGNILPKQFWVPDKFQCTGGVEYGFMSTTLNREVAMTYSGKGESIVRMVLELETGLVDRGADLQGLSQYPEEKEILFAPLTSLEVRHTETDGNILVVKTKANINLRNPTIDEVVAKRYQTLLGTMEANRIEAKQLFQSSLWQNVVAVQNEGAGGDDNTAKLEASDCLGVVEGKMKSILSDEAAAYNDDKIFMVAMEALVKILAEVRDQKASLLRELGNQLKQPRLEELADLREAMEVSKQRHSFDFKARGAGIGELWLFRALGLSKAQDGHYYPALQDGQGYRSHYMERQPIASPNQKLPLGSALLAANDRRDLEVWAREVQDAWQEGSDMKIVLDFSSPRSIEEFSSGLKNELTTKPSSDVATYLLCNPSHQELDLDNAGLSDLQGKHLFDSLSQTSEQRRVALEYLVLGRNKFGSAFAKSFIDAANGGSLARLRLLQLFQNTLLCEDMTVLRGLLAAVAKECCLLEVLNLTKIGFRDDEGDASFVSTWSSIFGSLFGRLLSFQFGYNEAATRTAAALVAGLQIAAEAQRHNASGLPLKRLWLIRNPKLFAGIPESFCELVNILAASAPSLEELPIGETGLAGPECVAALTRVLPSLGKLKTLGLNRNPKLFVGSSVRNIGAFMEGLGKCPLQELWLQNCGLCGASDTMAKILPKLPKLRKLLLDDNPQFIVENAKGSQIFMESIAVCPELEELWIQNCGLCEASDTMAKALRKLPKLKKLLFGTNPHFFESNAESCRILMESIAFCPEMEDFTLNSTNFCGGRRVGEVVAAVIPKLPKLCRFWLDKNADLDNVATDRIKAAVEEHGGVQNFLI